MQELVRVVREVRNRYTLDSRTPLDVTVRCVEAVAADFRLLTPFIASLAGVGKLQCGPDAVKPRQAATHVHPEFETWVSLEGLIDVVAEIARLEKQIAEKSKHLLSTRAKLENSGFVSRRLQKWCNNSAIWSRNCRAKFAAIEASLFELRQG